MGKIEEEREELVGVDAQINERKLECPLGCRRAGFNCAEVPPKIFVWERTDPHCSALDNTCRVDRGGHVVDKTS